MMPMATASFSFDLFGIGRHKSTAEPAVCIVRGNAKATGISENITSEVVSSRADQRDCDRSFWAMFPVL